MLEPLQGGKLVGAGGAAQGNTRINEEFPGINQQVLISWVFIWASIFLLLDFIFLQLGNGPLGAFGDSAYLTNHANIDYLMGVASCFLWLLGFLLLTHWHIYSINDTKSIGLLGTLFKLLAAVFFNMQSISALWDETASASLPAAASGGSDSGADAPNWFTSPLDYGNVAPGNAYRYQIGWSNFTGICLFHFGNMLSVYFMMSPSSELFKYNDKFHFSNAPVWGMWVYLLATTFLVTSNALGFFCSDPDVEGAVDDCDVKYGLFWGFTAFCQVAGATLLLLGSCIYLWWSTATHRSNFACIPCLAHL